MTSTDRWLFALADPDSLRSDLPHERLDQRQVAALTVLAEVHGVLPAVLAHIDELFRRNPELLLTKPKARGEVSAAIEPMRKRIAERSAIAMFLNAESRKLCAAFSAAGAQVIPLKGGDFAARLYKPASLRSFVDVDLLVRAEDWERVEATMSRLGFAEHKTQLKHAGGYSERTWEHPSVPGAMIEVHDDLVNSPTVRRGVSVRLEDLPLEQNADQSLRATPAGLLIIAAVHAAASHSFDKVQHLCDLAQIVRGRAGMIDETVVRDCAGKTGAGLSLALALDLVSRAFNETAVGDLVSRLNMNLPRLTRWLITPGLVASAQGERLRRGLWRRRLLRQMLKSRR